MNKNKVQYSVIIPFYNNEHNVCETYIKLKSIMDLLNESYEVLFINDDKNTKTLELSKKLCKLDKNIKLLSLSKNLDDIDSKEHIKSPYIGKEMMFIIIGISEKYIDFIHDEFKGRPIYIIGEKKAEEKKKPISINEKRFKIVLDPTVKTIPVYPLD